MEESELKRCHRHKIHRASAHSYLAYLIFILVGIVLDFVFRFEIFANSAFTLLGFLLIACGTILVYWSQTVTHTMPLRTTSEITKESFTRGPYAYTRSPTQWGLFFLMLGFAVILNAIFVVLCTFFAFLVTRLVFLRRREKIMEEHYGEHYVAYKQTVRL